MCRLADSTALLRLPDHLHNSPSYYNRYDDTYETPNRGSEIPILLARNQKGGSSWVMTDRIVYSWTLTAAGRSLGREILKA